MTITPDTKVNLSLYTLGAFALGCIIAFLWFDTRYAHAENVRQKIDAVQANINVKASELRRDSLEDRVFEIEAIPQIQRTNAQRAILSRAKAKLEAEEAKLREAEREKDKMR